MLFSGRDQEPRRFSTVLDRRADGTIICVLHYNTARIVSDGLWPVCMVLMCVITDGVDAVFGV